MAEAYLLSDLAPSSQERSSHLSELQPNFADPAASAPAEGLLLSQSRQSNVQAATPESCPARSSSQQDDCPRHMPVANACFQLLWTPFWLRRTVLTCFLATFAILVIALEVLSFVSKRNQGLATIDASKHYLWTYGPTAGKCLVDSTIIPLWEH